VFAILAIADKRDTNKKRKKEELRFPLKKRWHPIGKAMKLVKLRAELR